MIRCMFIFGIWTVSFFLIAKQSVDNNFTPAPFPCKYCQSAKPPVVAIDSAHFNYHTFEGRFAPFAKVLEADNINVFSNRSTFTDESLAGIDLLVIANALHEENKTNWDLPVYSAFTRDEIDVLYQWVQKGGSLFLIADHMPWPAASAALADLFGFGFFNGYVEIVGHREQFFTQAEHSILESPVTPLTGPNAVGSVQGFLGQGFTIPANAIPVLQFTHTAISWMPAKSWQIDESTPFFDATLLYQGALLKSGKGKVAVFGEAGMFTAQVVEEEISTWEMGMNVPSAAQNQTLLLNTVHWLLEKE